MANTPCHIISGPLGVGKTTTILEYLRQNASNQRVGVLVNDFGPVGLDSTTLQAEAPGTQVLNVPGGCICCTMLAELPRCINQLLAEQNLDRLIIEPSGMASPAQVIDMLRGAQLQLKINLQPAVVMLSAVDFDEETFERMGYYRMFYEAADILVFNRCDQASEAKIERARKWAAELDPPKMRVITTSHGQLPAELFESNRQVLHERESAGHHHDHKHSHDHSNHHHDHKLGVHPGGFILDAEQCFDQEMLLVNLMRICYQGIEGNEIMRLKGVFQTNTGWQSIEIANQEVSFRPSAHRRDNRMEWLTKPGTVDSDRIIQEIGRPPNLQEIATLLEKD